jgi:hypothetical protein
VRAAEQHGKAAIAVGASAPSTPVLMAARYRPGPVSRIRRSPPPELPGASGQHGE